MSLDVKFRAKAEKFFEQQAKVNKALMSTRRQAVRHNRAMAKSYGILKQAAGTALGIIISKASFGQAARQYQDLAKKMDNLAKKARAAGLGFESFQRWAFATEQAGGDVEALTKILIKLNTAIGEQQRGTGTYGQALEQMGIWARNGEDALMQMVEAFHEGRIAGDSLYDLLGARLIPAFVNLAQQGPDALRELRDGFEGVFTADQLEAAERFNDRMNELSKIADTKVLLSLSSMGSMLVWLRERWVDAVDAMADAVAMATRADKSMSLPELERQLKVAEGRAAAGPLKLKGVSHGETQAELDKETSRIKNLIAQKKENLRAEKLQAQYHEDQATAIQRQGEARKKGLEDEKRALAPLLDMDRKRAEHMSMAGFGTPLGVSGTLGHGQARAIDEAVAEQDKKLAQDRAQSIAAAAEESSRKVADAACRAFGQKADCMAKDLTLEEEYAQRRAEIMELGSGRQQEALDALDQKFKEARTEALEPYLNTLERMASGAMSWKDITAQAIDAVIRDFFKLQQNSSNIFGGMFGGGGGGGLGGLISKGVNWFSGLFAGGGTIPKGSWGIVGENEPEMVAAGPSGAIVRPMGGGRGQGLGGATINVYQTNRFDVGLEAVDARVEAVAPTIARATRAEIQDAIVTDGMGGTIRR